MFKKVTALFLFLVFLFVLAGCSNDVVATVNGDKISGKELDQCVAKAKVELEGSGYTGFDGENSKEEMERLRQQTLEEMINNRIVVQEARKMVTLSKDQITEILDNLKTQGQYQTDADFDKSFDRFYGVTKEDYAYIARMQEDLAAEIPRVADEEAQKFYNDNKDAIFTQKEEYVTRHVLFLVDNGDGTEGRHSDEEALGMAQDVINRLGEGAEFPVLAAQESEDLGTKTTGGQYSFKDEGTTAPEYVDAVKKLSPGQYTQAPVKTTYGYHVIKLEEIVPASTMLYDDEKEDIINYLTGMEIQKHINDKMMEAKQQAVITNTLVPEEAAPVVDEPEQTPEPADETAAEPEQ